MSEQDLFDELSDDEFDNAIIVRANEPDDDIENGITITRTEFELCAPEPLRLVVLMHWRSREQEGQRRTAEAIWGTLTELGMRGSNDEALVRLDEVRAAVDFLLDQGLIVQGGEL